MSAPVDVLAVLDREIEEARKRVPFMPPGGTESTEHQQAYDESGSVLVNLRETRAAVAELIEADAAFDAAALEVATYEAMTAYPSRNYRTVCYVQYREAVARRKAALARAKGGAA